MFNIRPLRSTVQDYRVMAEYSASGDAIPLQENWKERWCALPEVFQNVLPSILSLQVRDDDVFVVTFMKCGTTWMQETAWMLMNHLDFERADKQGVLERSIFIDFPGLYPDIENSIELCNKAPSPRLIKSHLPANLLPRQLWEKKQKTIYVARNVKDVIVSSYHFLTGLGNWIGSLDEFIEEFMSDEIVYTSFWGHIVDFWRLRHEPFIFFVTYEEMKRDLPGVLKRLCKFLERPELTAEELTKILEHLSFEKMKSNDRTNLTAVLKRDIPTKVQDNFQFMRRGIVGAFKDELSEEQKEKLDNWSEEFLSKYGIRQKDIFDSI